ncbi:MAG: putative LPS assembly protein LptD [Bacteroidales bacterium]
MVRSVSLLCQEEIPPPAPDLAKPDTVIADTISPGTKQISPNAIDKQVIYSCEGVKRNDLVNKRAILTVNADVKYGDMEIKADSIVFNMATNTVFAAGRKDTTGKITGKPVFTQGGQEIESDSILYNFVTRKAIAYRIMTKQEEGLLHSQVTKLLEDGTSNISRSTYSTCDLDPPHFYIDLPKAKIYPGKKIISGPGYLVLEGIPLPIAVPFGFFPIQTKRAASGILIPKVGEEQLRGYNLTDGGYYFAINDYFDLALKGSIYTNGTWLLNAASNYDKRYKYNGQFSFSYANNISGHKGLKDYSKTTNYKLGWTYTQDAKAHPGSSFSANVNMSSSGYDRTNSYNVQDHVQTQRQSSVSYSKTWEGTPFNLSMSMYQSQFVPTKTISMDLPKLNFNMNRIYPLKGRNQTGTTKWYQELQLQYTASLDNQINTYDSLLFKKETWSNLRNGFQHQIPVSLQIRPFRNFSISPSLTYTGVLYTQKYNQTWVADYRDPELNTTVSTIVRDTTRGVFYGQALNPSISASFNPQIFGMYTFSPDSRIQAIRHVMKPSVSFSYVPSLKGLSTDFYRQVQYDTAGHIKDYSIFEGSLFGTPSQPTRNAVVSFNLTNIVEAKVFARNDTTGKPKKVSLIDNLGINTSYNVYADSMRWAPVTMGLVTRLFNNVGISAQSRFSLYGINEKGLPVAKFALMENRKLMRLTNFSLSLDFDLYQLISGNKNKQTPETPGPTAAPVMGQDQAAGSASRNQLQTSNFDQYGYEIFNIPWSMRVSYRFEYSKPAFDPVFSQTLAASGNVTLTKKFAITYTTGYDFTRNEITMTNIGITRDLHCWTMSLNWVPNGTMKMWNFTIRVKASVLSDLKYERRKDFHDTYY